MTSETTRFGVEKPMAPLGAETAAVPWAGACSARAYGSPRASAQLPGARGRHQGGNTLRELPMTATEARDALAGAVREHVGRDWPHAGIECSLDVDSRAVGDVQTSLDTGEPAGWSPEEGT